MAKKKTKKEHGVAKIFETFENMIAAGSDNPKPKKKKVKKKVVKKKEKMKNSSGYLVPQQIG